MAEQRAGLKAKQNSKSLCQIPTLGRAHSFSFRKLGDCAQTFASREATGALARIAQPPGAVEAPRAAPSSRAARAV